jgi:hypothetical protein
MQDYCNIEIGSVSGKSVGSLATLGIIRVILVGAVTLCEAERLIAFCEHCNPDSEIPSDWTLDRISISDSSVTDYDRCRRNAPLPKGEITVTSFVEPAMTNR